MAPRIPVLSFPEIKDDGSIGASDAVQLRLIPETVGRKDKKGADASTQSDINASVRMEDIHAALLTNSPDQAQKLIQLFVKHTAVQGGKVTRDETGLQTDLYELGKATEARLREAQAADAAAGKGMSKFTKTLLYGVLGTAAAVGAAAYVLGPTAVANTALAWGKGIIASPWIQAGLGKFGWGGGHGKRSRLPRDSSGRWSKRGGLQHRHHRVIAPLKALYSRAGSRAGSHPRSHVNARPKSRPLGKRGVAHHGAAPPARRRTPGRL
jgi:hypothetical protein